MNPAIVIGILVMAGISTAVASGLLTRREFHRRFLTRPATKPHSMLSEFAPDDAQFLGKLLPRLEVVLGVPSGRLRLSDRFSDELRANPKFAIYQAGGDVLEDLQECFPHEQLRVSTVRDYCEAVLRLRRSQPEKDWIDAIFG